MDIIHHIISSAKFTRPFFSPIKTFKILIATISLKQFIPTIWFSNYKVAY